MRECILGRSGRAGKMPRPKFKITVKSGPVTKTLTKLGERVNNMTPALKRVGEYLTQKSKQSFRNYRDPNDGTTWPSLSPVYAAWKRKNGYTKGPLTRKGRLRRSVHYVLTGKTKVAVGTNVEYGAIHQFGGGGTSLGRSGGMSGAVPRRRFLGMSRSDEPKIQNIVKRYIMEAR